LKAELQDRTRLRRFFLFGAAALLAACANRVRTAVPAPDDSLLQRMLVAEDARGAGADGIAPLLQGARSSDTTIRRVAIRGLGRLQRPALDPVITLALRDSLPSVRAEAANALAQCVQGAPAHSQLNADARATLIAALRNERDPQVLGAVAMSLGRLPVEAEGVIETREALVGAAKDAGGAKMDVAFWDAFADASQREKDAARTRRPRAAGPSYADVRRNAWHFERIPAGARDGIMRGLYALARMSSTRELLMQDADISAIVGSAARYTADPHASNIAKLILAPAGAAARGAPRPAQQAPPACAPLEKAARSPDVYAALAAIDALGGGCGEFGVSFADTLRVRANTIALSDTSRTAGSAGWLPAAHALIALSRQRPELSDELLPRFMNFPNPFVREYAARAAAVYNDSALVVLFDDPDGNVRAAAIAGLSRLRQHHYDRAYIAALSSSQYQVVLAATAALAGSKKHEAVPALLDALDRLSAQRRENSRDERIAILNRVTELGSPANGRRIRRYLADFDTTVAAKAAVMLTKWTGKPVVVHPRPLRIRIEPLAETFRERGAQLRITMAPSSGGGTILVNLFTDEAPATIARITRLTRAHYYDGLTFHRIVPGFVIQGGSPGANEQVGDAQFMRDELGMRSHDRGTLGISTRGRDTGDAQFFINLADNPRLDHDYTVFGQVISGMNVVDRILEGDVMARVEVLGGTIPR
jgi:cyclophilin family peptidyl-prolyl cis-trans isomerase/HEAT repeat protein